MGGNKGRRAYTRDGLADFKSGVLLSWFSRWLIVPKKLREISFLGVHPDPLGSLGGFIPAKFYGDDIVL